MNITTEKAAEIFNMAAEVNPDGWTRTNVGFRTSVSAMGGIFWVQIDSSGRYLAEVTGVESWGGSERVSGDRAATQQQHRALVAASGFRPYTPR